MTGEPTFPPLIEGFRVDEGDEPSAEACRAASSGDGGAGDLFWSASEARFSLALILEPDVNAVTAMDMLFVAMVAFGDSIGAIAPPEVGVGYTWPQTLLVNGARVGSVSVRLAPGTGPRDVPEWMVIELDARISAEEGMPEPGLHADRTTLWDEGCGELTRNMILESFVRHLKTWIHNWETDGVRAVREAWLARAVRPGEPASFDNGGGTVYGTFLGLDEAGNMLLKTDDATIVADLSACLQPDPYGWSSP